MFENRVPVEDAFDQIGARVPAVPPPDRPVAEPEVEDGERRGRERCPYFHFHSSTFQVNPTWLGLFFMPVIADLKMSGFGRE